MGAVVRPERGVGQQPTDFAHVVTKSSEKFKKISADFQNFQDLISSRLFGVRQSSWALGLSTPRVLFISEEFCLIKNSLIPPPPHTRVNSSSKISVSNIDGI